VSGGPTVTLAEAGRHSHLSVATLRRWLNADKFPGAIRSPRDWSIPVASLVEAGAWPSATPPDPDDDQADGPDANALADLEAELTRLRAALDAERTRREAADALRAAAERNADDLRTALRMLEAGRSEPPSQQTEPPKTNTTVESEPENQEPAGSRPGIWKRIKTEIREFR